MNIPKIRPRGDFALELGENLRMLGNFIGEVNVVNDWDTSRKMVKGVQSYDPNWLTAHKIALLALIGTEASEAIEEVRHGEPMNGSYYYDSEGRKHGALAQGLVPSEFKPEGVPSELADIIIRVLDIADTYKIDIGAAIVEKVNHNAMRGPRHGGKTL